MTDMTPSTPMPPKKEFPEEVRVEDGLILSRCEHMDPHNPQSPCWYRTAWRGTWRDWVQLAEAILAAEGKSLGTSPTPSAEEKTLALVKLRDEALAEHARSESLTTLVDPALDFVKLLNAQGVVLAASTFKRFIDATPLENDIAVWMAEYAQAVSAPLITALAEKDAKNADLSEGNKKLCEEVITRDKRIEELENVSYSAVCEAQAAEITRLKEIIANLAEQAEGEA